MPNSVPTKTSFKEGHIRSQESIKKQIKTMKEQCKNGIRISPKNFNAKPPKNNKLCIKCGISFLPISANQKWCLLCVPDRNFRPIMQRYGLSHSEHNNLLITNNGLCWICLERKAVVVDHCHKTGKVRGLLCHKCNMQLPIIENKEVLRRAIKYVSI